MTAPRNSFDTDFGRFYAHHASGVQRLSPDDPSNPQAPNPSITNIISMMDKKFLPDLYARLVAEHAVNNLRGISYTLDKFGLQTAVDALKSIPSRPNIAAAIGDEVHAAIDWLLSGTGDVPPEFDTPTAKNMFEQAKYFFRAYPVKILHTEFTVWSYRYGYAGTGDLAWLKDDELWIVDTKTGNRVYPEVAMQTSALANADVIIGRGGEEIPITWDVSKVRLGVLHVRPRSVKLFELEKADEAFEAFLACKRLLDWKRFDAPGVVPTFPKVRTEKSANLVVLGGTGKPMPTVKRSILDMADDW